MSDSNVNIEELDARRELLKLDSSQVEMDMSPIAIQKRLETLGQLSRLANYLAKGIVLGKAEECRDRKVTGARSVQSKD